MGRAVAISVILRVDSLPQKYSSISVLIVRSTFRDPCNPVAVGIPRIA